MHILLHNAAVLGGAAQRKRLWVVWAREDIPFGVEATVPKMIPTVDESIGDLEGMHDTFKPQPYRRPATWWSESRRSSEGVVDGHKLAGTKANRRIAELFDAHGNEIWQQGENLSQVLKRIHTEHGQLPGTWEEEEQKIVARGFDMGINQPFRLPDWRPARVVTGGALVEFIHPHEPRTLTHREAARIQGFPDVWRVWPVRDVATQKAAWGKGVPVESARWLAYWMKRSLNGDPGTMRGIPHRGRDGMPERDIFVVNHTHINKLIQTRDGRGHLKTF
jgi:site-specific DNA-cytosine methylase